MKRLVTAAIASGVFALVLLAGCGRETTTTTVSIVASNGITVIARENTASDVVALQLWLRDGALFETAEQAGAANLLRGVLFTQTEDTEYGELLQRVESMGGAVGSSCRHDFTYYSVTVPSVGYDTVVSALEDGLLRPVFDEERFDDAKEKTKRYVRTLSERPVDMAYRLCLREMMGDHPYGRLPEGTEESIDNLTIDDIRSRFAERYVGSNMLIAITGNMDPLAASEAIVDALSEVPMGEYARPASPPVTWLTESRSVTERADVIKACQVVGFPGPSVTDEHSVAMDVLLVILMEGRSSRLNTRLKEELELVHSIGAGWYTQYHPSPLFVWMELPEENIPRAEDAVVELMKEMAKEPVSEEELAKAKIQLESGNLRMVETAEGQAFHIGYWNAIGGEEFAEHYVQNLGLVTAEEVQEAAELYLGSGVHCAAVILPK